MASAFDFMNVDDDPFPFEDLPFELQAAIIELTALSSSDQLLACNAVSKSWRDICNRLHVRIDAKHMSIHGLDRRLTMFPYVSTFRLSGSRPCLSDVLPLLRRAKNLRTLDVQTGILGVESIAHLCKITSLTRLSLVFQAGGAVPMVSDLSALTQLEELHLACAEVALPSLKAMKKLHTVSLLMPLTSVELEAIGSRNRLTALALHSNLLTEPNLSAFILSHSALCELDLSDCIKVSDQTLSALSALKFLRTLRLDRCWSIENGCCSALLNIPSLRVLSLRSCWRLQDAGMQILQLHQEIQELHLAYCFRLSDEGIRAVLQLPKLRRLNIALCTEISHELKDEIRSQKPMMELICDVQA